jgi:hypothetical protein
LQAWLPIKCKIMHYYTTTHIVKDRMLQNAFTELNVAITDRRKIAKNFQNISYYKKFNFFSRLRKVSSEKESSLFVCCPGITTHCVCIFHSPVASFSLLVFDVSCSLTTTRHSR